MDSSPSVPLSVCKQRYKIRDLFFGDNNVSQDIPHALVLAAACEHPEARWLTSLFVGKDEISREQAREVFLGLGESDARALCFAWRLGGEYGDDDLTLLHRSAELVFPYAQACLAWQTTGEKCLKLAQLAAARGEREGFYWLGMCFHFGRGCKTDVEMAKQNYLVATKLGHVGSMDFLGRLYGESDPQRWRWWGVAARLGSNSFLNEFAKKVAKFHSGAGRSAAVFFQIGQALKGNVDDVEKKIFNNDFDFASWIGPANQAISFYDAQIKACRAAIQTWTLYARKLGVVRDIRILIGKMIWEEREEANYQGSESNEV